MRPSVRTPLLFCALAVPLAACGEGEETSLVVERDTLGDTLVVRTIAGSEWDGPRVLEPEVRIGAFEGEDEYMLGDVNGFAVGPDGSMYVYDRQVPVLRKYAPDGTFEAAFGREGGGPGEYKQSDGGVAVLPDGRVLLRDPGNGRINVYSPEGEPLDQWELRGGYFTSRPLYVDTAGRAWTQIWGTGPGDERYSGLQGYEPTGEKADSVLAPAWDYEPPTIQASGERFTMVNSVPFSPTQQWVFSPAGFMIGGVSTRYAVDAFRPDGTVLRLERTVDPVPVDADEKANAEERATHNFRQSLPDWKWNGPPIPDQKPPFRAIHAGRDGRIYVQLSTRGERVPEEELGEPSGDPGQAPPNRWREPVVYDVFQDDGTYLGQIRAPAGFRTYPEPIFDGDQVWALVTDEMDVQYLTRFRAVAAEEEGDDG